jgi:hypothetical protein
MVRVREVNILNELEKGIRYGLENNEYVRQRTELHRKKWQTLICQVDTEISTLQVSKTQIENLIQGQGRPAASLLIDSSAISEQMIALQIKRLEYGEELAFVADLQVLQHFFKFYEPESPRLLLCLAVGGLAGLILALLLGTVKDWKHFLSAETRV